MSEDYRAKLEAFFDLVPKYAPTDPTKGPSPVEYIGEVLSTDPKFVTLTGITHQTLTTEWAKGSLLTSCNGFVGKVALRVGVTGMGGFNVEKILTKMGKRHCWITPLSGEKPQFGDIYETRSHTPGKDYDDIHVGVSLYVEGDTWYTIEGGQGGPKAGVDKVARIKKKYNTTHVLGWVDMRLLTSGKPPQPDWLLGTWMIYAGQENYYYSFNRYGEATQKAYRPMGGQDQNVHNRDTGKVISIAGDTIKVQWNREGGIETFTYDRLNSFPSLNEKMTGVAADGTAMKGVRM